MLALVWLTIGATAVMIPLCGLSFPPGDVIPPIATCAALLALALFYRRRAENFVLCLQSLAILVAFSTAFSMLTYCVAARTSWPLADELLLAIDGLFGLSAPAVVHWINDRPTLALVMKLIYFSIIPQTIVLITVLGFANERQRVERFLARFVMCAILTCFFFYFLPAKGTYACEGVETPRYCEGARMHLEQLRAGERTLVTWRDMEGIITFPSFHTVWAVLLASAFYRHPLFWPAVALNALVVASTVTTGMHYFTDVFGGLVLVMSLIHATRGVSAASEPARAAVAGGACAAA